MLTCEISRALKRKFEKDAPKLFVLFYFSVFNFRRELRPSRTAAIDGDGRSSAGDPAVPCGAVRYGAVQGRRSEKNSGGLKGSEGETRIRVKGGVLLGGKSSQ